DSAGLVRINQGHYGGNEKCCANIVTPKNVKNAWHTDAPAALTPRQWPGSEVSAGERADFMIAVE
ncbi:MAG: hypothetical protein OEX13_12660, partial [Gammaproteobacteria bacterium]|nr:hypothetical protein [Gammaproteobacteria bacterium]